jgi:outer membrane protein TolC
LRIALEQQPALAAHRASLAAADTAYRGLVKLHAPVFLARDLPIRRHQAHLGLAIAEAGLTQAEAETNYAVTRTYYGVLYARAQLRTAQGVATSLRFYQERVSELVKKGETREWTTSTVDKITLYLRLAETRQAEATRGIDRATAALREAMGVPPEYAVQVAEGRLPSPTLSVNRAEIVALALERRGELIQATTAAEVVDLEITAQGKTCLPTARTFAAGADLHARPVPQGISNSEYRPGATSLEMPTLFAGPRSYRVERARDFSARAAAVVDKTRNLVALDAEDAYFKWEEASRKVPMTREAAETGARLSKNTRQDFTAGQKVRIEDILTNEVLAGQAQGSYNEALYLQIIALADLQRVTAGGFNAGFTKPPATLP